jgi:hypothetical protein
MVITETPRCEREWRFAISCSAWSRRSIFSVTSASTRVALPPGRKVVIVATRRLTVGSSWRGRLSKAASPDTRMSPSASAVSLGLR